MPIRRKSSSRRVRNRSSPKKPSNQSSSTSSFSNLEDQNYTRLYNDITNPLDIMKCRHPLETGLKLTDITNPNNDRFNRNILKKICISDNDFEHLCKSPNTSSKYKNLLLTPIQKAMTYCMIHDGGSTTDEAILAFILRFWKTISEYNSLEGAGISSHKYRCPPTKRILHINYSIAREIAKENTPLFIQYGDDRFGVNTVDGVTIKNRNSRVSSKEKILKINDHIQKNDPQTEKKSNESNSKRSKRRSGSNSSINDSNASKSTDSKNSNESKNAKSNSDLSKRNSSRSGNVKDDSTSRKSGNDEMKSNQRDNRNQKSNKSTSNGNNNNNDIDMMFLNDLDQNNNESDSNLSENSEKGSRRGNGKNQRKSATNLSSNQNLLFSPYSSRSKNSRTTKHSSLIKTNGFRGRDSENGEAFQEMLLNAIKNDSKNSNGGMTLNEIVQACQSFRYAPGAYYGLSLERRVKSVLFMKKQLKEVEFNESNSTWSVLSDKKKNIKKDLSKKIQKALNEKENQTKDENNNEETGQNNSGSDDDADSMDEKKSYMPQKLKIVNMKELTIDDLWNIVNDVGLYS